MLSDLQSDAIRAWTNGKNVRVIAVPGAGKSRVLIEACAKSDGICLILAYNRELCDETKERIAQLRMQDWVICMTFHGLATYCVGPTHDDVTLVDRLDRLDAGAVPEEAIKRLDRVDNLLVDECQDFRPTFLRLLRHVVPMGKNAKVMTVGDPNQMLYDYIEDDAADLCYLQRPHEFFLSERDWETVELDETHRMTPEIASVVNGVYDTAMRSARMSLGKPVEIYTISMWKAGPLIAKLLHGELRSECCILVPRKKNNGPLRSAVNRLSKLGFKVWIHGIDGQDPRTKKNKLSVSTWHASKGTQKRVVIVLGYENGADRNPGYVALTRAQDRLIIVQDDAAPHHGLIRALKELPSTTYIGDRRTVELVQADAVPESAPWSASADFPLAADDWRPSGTGRWLASMARVVVEQADEALDVDDDDGGAPPGAPEDEVVENDDHHEDVGEMYRLATIIRSEHESTRKIRRVADLNAPLRLKPESQRQAIASGTHARIVSKMPDDLMLEPEARRRVKETMARLEAGNASVSDWCFLACACNAWNNYHHALAQLEPYDWMDGRRLDDAVDFLSNVFDSQEDVVYDARLHGKTAAGRVVHARCCATARDGAILTVWTNEIGHGEHMKAAIIAALHPARRCLVANLKLSQVKTIELDEADAVELVERVGAPRAPRILESTGKG